MDLVLDEDRQTVDVNVDWSKDNIKKTLVKLQECMSELHKETVEKNHARQDKARELQAYVDALKPGKDREQLASRIKTIKAKLKA
ncbi:hypothetical protein Ae201684P_003574 [Aphanomyces euteiches]|nr:hypothetical protein Ae201684P_003574 [Aphanomyces euteiches]